MELDKLLNKLIEKGWRPFDVKGISEYFFESVPVGLYRLCWKKPDYDYNVYSKRDLVSKESGLWQFVCGNKKLHNFPKIRIKNPTLCDEGIKDADKDCNDNFYEYWLIECALCDEDKLEKFLLDNIKV